MLHKYIFNQTLVKAVSYLFVFFFLGPIHSQSLKASENPLPINSNVTLSTQNAVTVGAWLFNNSIIVIMYPGQQIVSDKWKDRVTLSLTQNHTSLTMASVQVEDSGEYKLQQFQGNSQEFSIQLSVQGEIMSFLFPSYSFSVCIQEKSSKYPKCWNQACKRTVRIYFPNHFNDIQRP